MDNLIQVIHHYLVSCPYVKRLDTSMDGLVFLVIPTEDQLFTEDDKLVQGMMELLNDHPELEVYNVTMKYVGGIFVISLL